MIVWKNCFLILLFLFVVIVLKLIKSNFIFVNFIFNILYVCIGKCEIYIYWFYNVIINVKEEEEVKNFRRI